MIIMRKGIAERTLVMLILAVIILGLLGYLIYTNFAKVKCKIDSTGCLAARIECCCGRATLAEAEKECVSCGPDEIADCTGMPCAGPCE